MKKFKPVFILFLLFCAFSCNNKKAQNQSNESVETLRESNSSNSDYSSVRGYSSQSNSSNQDIEIHEDDNEDDSEIPNENEKLSDGSHSATVEYYNPQTGYSQTYTLDVEVEDGEVIQIDFPNGGYLDEDHIAPSELDEEGNAHIDGDEGRTYEVQIED